MQCKAETQKIFAEEKEKLAKKLQIAVKSSNICITLDIWTDTIRHLDYLGAVIHYLQFDANKKHTLVTKAMALKVKDAEDDKNAENVHHMVMGILADYDLYEHIDNIVFVTDRGPDIKAALAGYNRHFCFSHMLNNIVKHASEPDIDKLTSSISKIVKYMNWIRNQTFGMPCFICSNPLEYSF